MKTLRISVVGVVIGALFLAACGSSSKTDSTPSTASTNATSTSVGPGPTATNRAGPGPTATNGTGPASTSNAAVSSAVTAAVREALASERSANATYQSVLAKYPGRNPFANVQASEAQHVQAVEQLATTRGIDVSGVVTTPQSVPATFAAACGLGVTIEQQVIAMYTRLLPTVAQYSDITRVFQNLRSGSQDHLTAFQRCSQ